MFWRSGCICKRAIVDFGLLGQPFKKTTLIARCLKGLNEKCLAFEARGRPINIKALSFIFISIHLIGDTIQIFPGLDIIEPSYNNIKLLVKMERHLLNSLLMGNYLDAGTSFHDELRKYLCFKSIDIFLAKQELPIQISKINCVHVDNVNVSYARQCQILN